MELILFIVLFFVIYIVGGSVIILFLFRILMPFIGRFIKDEERKLPKEKLRTQNNIEKPLKHFIITRFNLSVSDKNWMNYRMEIFTKYCLPSVLNQSNKNFIWLICLDTDTDTDFKTFFLNLHKKYNFIVPLFINGMQDFDVMHKHHIINHIQDADYVVTSRLDNDDIIHKDYIKRIQEQFNYQKYMAVNFLKILIISTETEKKLHIDYSFSNHFISLIERVNKNKFKGCYDKKDRAWDVKGEIIQITNKPYVTETINGRNLLNNFRGFPVTRKTALNDFGLNGIYSNKLFDKANFKLHKMCWRKLAIYLKLCITTAINQ